MWKPAAVLLLASLSQLALALPTPKDIETAVNAGHYSQAESMLREVVQAKPQSAKAYYELGQVLSREGRRNDASLALHHAQQLDPTLKFARDPRHFQALLLRIDGNAATSATGGNHVSMSPHAGFPWSYVLIGGGLLLVLGWMLSRRAAPGVSGSALAPTGPSAPPAAQGASSGYPPMQPPAAAGSGVGGAVLGGLAGLAAGYGLAKVLEHETPPHAGTADTSPVLIEHPPVTPSDDGNFDPGSGDSWDAAESDSTGGDW